MLIAGFTDEIWMPKKIIVQVVGWNGSLQEVQPPYFLLICTQSPAHRHPKLTDQMIRLNLSRLLIELESAVPFVLKKLPKTPFKWYVSAPSFSKLGETRSELEWSNGI